MHGLDGRVHAGQGGRPAMHAACRKAGCNALAAWPHCARSILTSPSPACLSLHVLCSTPEPCALCILLCMRACTQSSRHCPSGSTTRLHWNYMRACARVCVRVRVCVCVRARIRGALGQEPLIATHSAAAAAYRCWLTLPLCAACARAAEPCGQEAHQRGAHHPLQPQRGHTPCESVLPGNGGSGSGWPPARP